MSIEPNVNESLKQKRKILENKEANPTIIDYGQHYNSTNKWILIVFAIIVVLLVFIIIFLIIYKDRKNDVHAYLDKSSESQVNPSLKVNTPRGYSNSQQKLQQQGPQQLRSSQRSSAYNTSPIVEAYRSTQSGVYDNQQYTAESQQNIYSNTLKSPNLQNETAISTNQLEGDDDLKAMIRKLSIDENQRKIRHNLVHDIKDNDA